MIIYILCFILFCLFVISLISNLNYDPLEHANEFEVNDRVTFSYSGEDVTGTLRKFSNEFIMVNCAGTDRLFYSYKIYNFENITLKLRSAHNKMDEFMNNKTSNKSKDEYNR